MKLVAAADAAGVPEIAPVEALMESPKGSVGEIVKVIEDVPPAVMTGVKADVARVAVKFFVATATDADKDIETLRLKVLVAVSETESVTLTVYEVTVALSVGVPVIAPVEELNDNPEGRAGAIA